MSTRKPASWTYAEDFVPEPEAIESAQRRDATLEGAEPVSTGVGALLRVLAAGVGARHVIEVGTGVGVSGLWLLAGMTREGVLTTIDAAAEHSQAARESFAAAGIAHQRTRVITGRAADVLPRMTDEAYDLALIDADLESHAANVEHAIRLLRPGGLLVVAHMLLADTVADPAVRDPGTSLIRDLGKSLRDDPRLTCAMVPMGDGLIVAVKAASPQ